ncbi:hypothetical protein K488DRAFT_85355 [Vararia minispora EC-137]|uniref:Uncharacterized protein n=1 Tax=Vararia minispora EC-137 TaxID=1314806 RepID=A0ACB8QNK6_9AGAM|nr:hypothetical protein K488DRAFT_85355 [Vararia minispora EC-137]
MSPLVKGKLYVDEVYSTVFNPRLWARDTNALPLETMRVVPATGLFVIGVEPPRSYMGVNAKSLLVTVV